MQLRFILKTISFILVILLLTACKPNGIQEEGVRKSPQFSQDDTIPPKKSSPTQIPSVEPTHLDLPITNSPVPKVTRVPPTFTSESAIPSNTVLAPLKAQGWVAFISWLNNPFTIDVIRIDDELRRTILYNPKVFAPRSPSWSPNGQWIAFIASPSRVSNSQIYLIHPDGSGIKQITFSLGEKDSPTWSPNSKLILYSQIDKPALNPISNLLTIDIFSGKINQLTHDAQYFHPAFSPSGDKIALIQAEGKNSFLTIADTSLKNIQRLIDQPIGFGKISWSADGQELVIPFGNDCQDLFTVDKDGSGLHRLTNMPRSSEFDPSWSPDGDFISFTASEVCQEGGWGENYIIHEDGRGLTQIPQKAEDHPWTPIWSPFPPLIVGKIYTVTETGGGVQLRNSPELTGKVITSLKPEEMVEVIGGPNKNDEYLWWRVRIISKNQDGWIAEMPGWFLGKW